MKSILDRSFRYVPSHATDLRQTFERIRREREAASAPSVVPAKRDVKPERVRSMHAFTFG